MCGPNGTLSVASKFVVLTVLIGITLFMTLISTIILASHLDGHPTNTSKIIIFLFWFGYYLMYLILLVNKPVKETSQTTAEISKSATQGTTAISEVSKSKSSTIQVTTTSSNQGMFYKGQLISKELFGVIVLTKKSKKGFLP